MKKLLFTLFILLVFFSIAQAQKKFHYLKRDTSDYAEKRKYIQIYTEDIKEDSTDKMAFIQRFRLLYAIGDYEHAIEDMQKVIILSPAEAEDGYSNIGLCYCFMNDYKQAMKNFNKAIFLNPQDAMNYLNRAYAEMENGFYKEAIRVLDTALSIKPDYAKAYANRGFSKVKLGLYEEALKDYNQAIVLKKNYEEVYYNRGYLKTELKDYDGALADYELALIVFPPFADMPQFYEDRGRAYEKKGDRIKANADYKKAKELLK